MASKGYVIGRTKKQARKSGGRVYPTYQAAEWEAEQLNDELHDPVASGYFYAFPVKGKK